MSTEGVTMNAIKGMMSSNDINLARGFGGAFRTLEFEQTHQQCHTYYMTTFLQALMGGPVSHRRHEVHIGHG
jgi:hypothetical protein